MNETITQRNFTRPEDQPVIDFHTHIFPDPIAPKALSSLSASSHVPYWLDGTAKALQASMRENGISCSVILPVATAPGQPASINRTAIETNRHFQETGLLSFGAIHPDNQNYKEILHTLAREGVLGIKLHPVFQNAYIDDIRYLRIIDFASQLGLIILTHAGFDVSFPAVDYVTPSHIQNMLRQTAPPKMVLAHMGGWGCWDEVESLLTGFPVWLDTAFSLTRVRHYTGEAFPDEELSSSSSHEDPDYECPWRKEQETLDPPAFRRLVRAFGEDHILFASDSPWSSQKESILAVADSGISKAALPKIFFENAASLLSLYRKRTKCLRFDSFPAPDLRG